MGPPSSAWAVYYDDPALDFWSADGAPDEAPRLGVQCVAQGDELTGRQLLIEKDYYWRNHDEGRWYGGDLWGLFDYLSTTGSKSVLFGRFVHSDIFRAAVKRAQDDDRLPRKSAYTKKEAKVYPEGLKLEPDV